MKNLFLLTTEKPSRLLINKEGTLVLTSNFYSSSNPQNIYITSDEEIKEGHWLDLSDNSIIKVSKEDLKLFKSYDKLQFKKIILTTDQELIKDGVQAIDDEFLEWFVKNQSCESVETYLVPKNDFSYKYRIIIPEENPDLEEYIRLVEKYSSPKEEPKQETLEEDDLDAIENKIIECLNKADNKLNANDFNRLAESIIDYIDEISRNKSC
jgi:hypothetical protein